MRSALSIRDLAAVYRRLGQQGFSQRRIAHLTGQSPSEVYEIIKGRRVMAYDLLIRIADGLGVPRGYMGLAHAELDSAWEGALDGASPTSGEADEIRRLLSEAATITMGVSVDDTSRWRQPCGRAITPVPDRIGAVDVTQMEHITGVLRALDYRHGGGACRDAVVAQAEYARSLLTADSASAVRQRLRGTLADLHNLAGWTSFDVGLFSAARRHFATALELARECDNHSLVANVLYRLGRLHLHQEYTSQALKFFQLGQLAAQDAEDPLTVAMLHANEAWAYAIMGDRGKALNSLGRAQDEFTRPQPDRPRGWVGFFGEADLHALMGIVHGLLPDSRGDRYADEAVANLQHSIGLRADKMARSLTFELTAVATVHFRLGDVGQGLRFGNRAVDLAEQVRSTRTIDRLAPLRAAAQRHGGDDEVVALSHRIGTLRAG
ncbi:helix-turn-helix transcriptional regulator [Krasilnikovia sp. MM14-A1259]